LKLLHCPLLLLGRPRRAKQGKSLALFGLFRRQPPIRDLDELADFVDAQAAFVTQKGIYEYARARSGHYAKVLFRERMFQEAVEFSRWSAFPLGLVMVAEVVEGILRPQTGADRWRAGSALNAVVLSVFDRYPAPAPIGEAAWGEARDELVRRLNQIGFHPPKPAKDIPEQFAQAYFEFLPIHEQLRGRDFPTTRNYLRATLCNIHEEFSKRVDGPAVVGALKAMPVVTPEATEGR
jgi:hypothetical protein